MKQTLKQKISYLLAGCLLVFGFVVLITPQVAHAQVPFPSAAQLELLKGLVQATNGVNLSVSDIMSSIISGLLSLMNMLLSYFLQLLGGLVSLVTVVLAAVARYNGFSNQQQVIVGWKIVRDLVNSFFIVVLIAIAISTIIRFQVFNFRSTLPRLILAAFLVNFSRTICLVAINFSTSLMTTFTNQFEGLIPALSIGLRLPAIAANKQSTLGPLYFDSAFANDASVNAVDLQGVKGLLTTILASMLGIVMLMLALGGIVTFALILLFRILTLWFLMILSPLAFFLWGVPGRASKYWGEWLEEFVKHIIVGPVAAFLLYIILLFYLSNLQGSYGFSLGKPGPQATITLASRADIFLGFLVSLGLMMISFEIIQSIGVRGGSWAAKVGVEGIGKGGLRAMGAVASAPARYGARLGWWGAKKAAGAADVLAYSRGLPSVTGTRKAIEGFQAAIAGKRDYLLKEGDKVHGERLAKLYDKGSFGALPYALYSGNTAVLKNLGVRDIMSAVGGRALSSTGMSETDNLKKQYTSVRNSDVVASTYGALKDDVRAKISGLTQKDLVDFAKYKSNTDQIASLTRSLPGKTGAELATDQAKIAGLRAQTQAYEASADATKRGEMEGSWKSIKDFTEKLQQDGVDIKPGDTIADYVANRNANKTTIDARRKGLIDELRGRQKFALLATSATRNKMTATMKEYGDETYEKDVKYDIEDIYANAITNANRDSRYKFARDVLQSASEGKFDNLLSRLNPEFNTTVAGVGKFAKYLQTDIGLEEQEALTLIAEIQGRNDTAGKFAQTNYVALDGITKDFRLMSQPEHDKSVEKKVKNKTMDQILGSVDGLAHKDNLTGDWNIDEGLRASLQTGAFSDYLKKTRKGIPEGVAVLLKEKASELGLSRTDVERIEFLTKKSSP